MKERPCDHCEQLLQLYVDGELSEVEAREAETHLEVCGYCGRNYRFERLFRLYVRRAASVEPMSDALRAKLVALRR
jgi:anti-sigma factor RsiW